MKKGLFKFKKGIRKMSIENKVLSRRGFLISASSTIIYYLFNKCSKKKESIVGPADENNQDSVYKHLLFRVTYGTPPRGESFWIGVYDQETKRREVYGSSMLNGNFFTISKLNSSREYRIEIYKPSPLNKECIMAFWRISFERNRDMWRDNLSNFKPESELLPVAAHLGASWETLPLVSDAWGP